MGNSRGSYYSTRENSLAAYDQLPPTARKALQEAVFDWAPQPIRTHWRKGRKGFKTGPEIAKSVTKWDRDRLAKKGLMA